MNFLISMFIVFLSHAAYCSEPQHMKRSDSTDTINMCYTSEQYATELEKKYTALKFRNAQAETQLEQAARNNATLTAQNIELTQQLQDCQNEDYSCSIVGPRYRSWLCFKSQPLPKHIEGKMVHGFPLLRSTLYYHDKNTQQYLASIEPSCCETLQALLCIKPKLPDNIKIQKSTKERYEEWMAYFDKNTNRELDIVRYKTCYECCCCIKNPNPNNTPARQSTEVTQNDPNEINPIVGDDD